jgi:hypothetical protein
MKNRTHQICRSLCWLGLSGGLLLLCGCALFLPGMFYPNQPQVPQPQQHSPMLNSLSVSPNPVCAGSIVNLTAAYTDASGDLSSGVAAVAINGANLSQIAFRSTYTSGILTVPLPISYYSRPSDIQITLRIRDNAGNWSNSVATTLAIR